jgi:hypothetical protein
VPFWIWRLAFKLRGRKLARLHLTGSSPSVEGLLVGAAGGRYVVLTPKVLRDPEPAELTGHLEIPKENVIFIQVLDK